MVDLKTWWNYRDGKEITLAITILAGIIASMIWYSSTTPERDPDVCEWHCIEDINGVPRSFNYLKEHPELRPDDKE